MKITGDAFDRARRVQLIIFDVDGVLRTANYLRHSTAATVSG